MVLYMMQEKWNEMECKYFAQSSLYVFQSHSLRQKGQYFMNFEHRCKHVEQDVLVIPIR